MSRYIWPALAAAACLAGCGSPGNRAPGSSALDGTLASPAADRLAELNKAYVENALKARRQWGGKRLTLTGAVNMVGKLVDGTPSILLGAGDMTSLGEFRFDRRYTDFAAKLSKGDVVTADCTVDPDDESPSGATLVGCRPAGVRAASGAS